MIALVWIGQWTIYLQQQHYFSGKLPYRFNETFDSHNMINIYRDNGMWRRKPSGQNPNANWWPDNPIMDVIINGISFFVTFSALLQPTGNCRGVVVAMPGCKACVRRFEFPLDPQADWPGRYINVGHCGGLQHVFARWVSSIGRNKEGTKKEGM